MKTTLSQIIQKEVFRNGRDYLRANGAQVTIVLGALRTCGAVSESENAHNNG